MKYVPYHRAENRENPKLHPPQIDYTDESDDVISSFRREKSKIVKSSYIYSYPFYGEERMSETWKRERERKD